MTDRQLGDEVVTLVLAGHETTALVMFYVFQLLARSPQSENRMGAELPRCSETGFPPPTKFPTCDTPNGSSAKRLTYESLGPQAPRLRFDQQQPGPKGATPGSGAEQ